MHQTLFFAPRNAPGLYSLVQTGRTLHILYSFSTVWSKLDRNCTRPVQFQYSLDQAGRKLYWSSAVSVQFGPNWTETVLKLHQGPFGFCSKLPLFLHQACLKLDGNCTETALDQYSFRTVSVQFQTCLVQKSKGPGAVLIQFPSSLVQTV